MGAENEATARRGWAVASWLLTAAGLGVTIWAVWALLQLPDVPWNMFGTSEPDTAEPQR